MICGEQTRLRRIEREDIPTFVRWFADSEVRSFLLINSPISHAQEEKWFERKLDDDDSELFAIETDAIYRQGRYYDLLMMGVLDHEFAAL